MWPDEPGPVGPHPGPEQTPGRVLPLAVLVAASVFLVLVVAITIIRPNLQSATPSDDLDPASFPATARPGPARTAPRSPTTAEPAPDSTSSTTATTTAPETTISPPDQPTAAEELEEDLTTAQLRPPAAPPKRGETNALYKSSTGKPVGFNACRTIHYTVRVGAGPSNGLALVQQAVRQVESLTGLQFQYDGPADAVPKAGGRSGRVDLADAYRPVFIGWATRQETDIWAHEGGDALGVAAPQVITFGSGDELFVSGSVVLLPTSELTPTFGPGATVGNVLLHELGHLVGLDHVTDERELMVPALTPDAPDGYGPGDRRGLYDVGASRGCASSWLKLR